MPDNIDRNLLETKRDEGPKVCQNCGGKGWYYEPRDVGSTTVGERVNCHGTRCGKDHHPECPHFAPQSQDAKALDRHEMVMAFQSMRRQYRDEGRTEWLDDAQADWILSRLDSRPADACEKCEWKQRACRAEIKQVEDCASDRPADAALREAHLLRLLRRRHEYGQSGTLMSPEELAEESAVLASSPREDGKAIDADSDWA
jgi:hypothetical protein